VLIEDPLYVLGTGHVHDPETESMAALIPQNLREHHRAKRGEGLTELVIGAKVGQSADMYMGTHVEPSRWETGHRLDLHYACRIIGSLVTIALFRDISEVFHGRAFNACLMDSTAS
jgi:hypothetical protein